MTIPRRVKWLGITGLLLGVWASSDANAQCGTPSDPALEGWGKKITYYHIRFDPNDRKIPSGAISQITKAFEEWNRKLVQAGMGEMQFRAAVTDAQKNDAADRGIVIQKGIVDREKKAAASAAVTRVAPYTARATITYDFDYREVYQTAQRDNTLSTYIFKVTLHEIGHTFNLTDHPEDKRVDACTQQTPGATVMNDGCRLHDSGNNMPMTLSPCDLASIRTGPVVPSCCTGGGVGGSGGPVGGGNESCRAFLPDIDNCEAICLGQASYWTNDTCGNAWGDWCGVLFPDIWPNGDIVCETSVRIKMLDDMSLALAPVETPSGRYKIDGNGGCYWDATDSGPNQCEPAGGRWKLDGNGGCYWDANDSGPNQCTPTLAAGVGVSAGWRDLMLVLSAAVIALGGVRRRYQASR